MHNTGYGNFDGPDTVEIEINKEIDSVIQDFDDDNSGRPETMALVLAAQKINRICNDIKNVISMVSYTDVALDVDDIDDGGDYFDLAKVEISLAALLKEQVNALKKVVDSIKI